uniref:NAB domain-containing protein n=1 Tax=Fagus sylvatica TaxID=28930 RepID=A0A2N9FA78_FAGSY
MLQRAASNAYSWWWASHIRTKQSRWLEQNLQDMEEKVNNTLKIIDNDGDSFAQRAEMYYRKRPELINFVEESFRAYRALAERFDHLSKELQSANRTIATAFPERVEYAMDDDDEEEENLPGTSTSSNDPNNLDMDDVAVPESSIPKRTASSARAVIPTSGLSKTEALEEIDKLQKEILALQTEMEFAKRLYERGYEKYWEIEKLITETQKRVCSLQDEFSIGTVIEDDEARTLMAASALKSCKQSLVKLKGKQEQSVEDSSIEHQRFKEAREKFETIKDEFLPKQTDWQDRMIPELKDLDQEIIDEEQERHDKIVEQPDVNSKTSLTVMELAERIDELVNQVVTLETAVSSQVAMVNRLRSETDGLQAHVQSLEEDKETLMKSSYIMSKKINELEEELRRVKNLNQIVKDQNNNLQTHLTEASCNLDHLSGNLQCVKQDEEVEDTVLVQEVGTVPDAKAEEKLDEERDTMAPNESVISKDVMAEKDEKNDNDILALSNSVGVEEEKQSESNNDLTLMPEKTQEPMQQEKDEKQDSPETVDGNLDVKLQDLEAEEEEEHQPLWRALFVKGLEDREKILLDEYTSVLNNYKLVRKKLSEVEQKNRDSIFELAMHCPIASNYTTPQCKYIQQDMPQTASSQASTILSQNSDQKLLADFFGEPYAGSSGYLKISLEKEENKNKMKRNQVNKHNVALTVEDKIRSDIDSVLEGNLEFWLRFSTSVQQIQKFQNSIQDLHDESLKLKDKLQEGSGKNHSLQSDARPIYRHLREIQTELSLWLEHNAVLKDELQTKFSSMCNIQDEISRITNADSKAEKTELGEYQAAKFQGEVLNMKQENSKVSDELCAGLNRVRTLKVDVEKMLAQLDEELGISVLKKHSTNRARIPLRSFLFGVKLKKQKPSMFSCVTPALQKQYSDLAALPK